MDEEGIPGLGTYSVPGFGGDMPPMRESEAPASSASKVPGTPAATPGGVSAVRVITVYEASFYDDCSAPSNDERLAGALRASRGGAAARQAGRREDEGSPQRRGGDRGGMRWLNQGASTPR